MGSHCKRISTMFNLVVLVTAVAACQTPPAGPQSKPMTQEQKLPDPTTIQEAVDSKFRTPDFTARDKYRHPAETLEFFGVKPDMTVVEIWPSAGYYAQILAPLLAEHGQYIDAENKSTSSEGIHHASEFSQWMATYPQIAGKMSITTFLPPTQVDIAPAGTADMVLTFRNVHNWMRKHNEEAAFKAFFKALKPGGILGVEEHRGKFLSKQDPEAKSGYVTEAYVMKLAKKAGFKFVAKSEINANPKDTKDYQGGVWTLPPTLQGGDKDREKYLAIGESDRMTLKFKKPAKKAVRHDY